LYTSEFSCAETSLEEEEEEEEEGGGGGGGGGGEEEEEEEKRVTAIGTTLTSIVMEGRKKSLAKKHKKDFI